MPRLQCLPSSHLGAYKYLGTRRRLLCKEKQIPSTLYHANAHLFRHMPPNVSALGRTESSLCLTCSSIQVVELISPTVIQSQSQRGQWSSPVICRARPGLPALKCSGLDPGWRAAAGARSACLASSCLLWSAVLQRFQVGRLADRLYTFGCTDIILWVGSAALSAWVSTLCRSPTKNLTAIGRGASKPKQSLDPCSNY